MIIYNLAMQKLADLMTNDGLAPYGIKYSGKINEISKLEFNISSKNEAAEYLIEGNLIFFQNEAYEIASIKKTQNSGGLIYSVSCYHISKMLQEKTSPLLTYESTDANTALTNLLAPVSNFWQVGQCAIPVSTKRPVFTEHNTIFSALVSVAEMYNGYLTFGTIVSGDTFVGGYVNIYPADMKSADVLYLDAMNTISVDVSKDVSELTTRLYCFGGSDDTNNEDITIAPVNGGLTYLEDYSYFTSQGYSGAYIDLNPHLFRKESTFTNGSFKNPAALKEAGLDKLSILAKPKIDVKLKYLSTPAIPDIWLGKTVEYSDKLIDLFFYQTIVGYSINFDNPHEIDLETANYIDRKKEIPALFKNLKVSGYTINPDGTTRTKAIEKAVQLVEISADKVITGVIKSQNNNSWLNLNDGTFSFGNGALTWNSDTLEVLGKMNTPKVFSSGREFNTSYTYDIKFYEAGILSGVISPSFGVAGDFSTRVLDIMCSHEASILGFGIRDADNTVNRKYIINNSSDFAGQTQRHIFYDDMKINGSVSVNKSLSSWSINCISAIISDYSVNAPFFIHSTSTKVVIGGTSSDIYLGASELPLSVYATTLRPSADNAISLGQSGRRWSTVWAVNGTIQTSGLKDKENIKPLKNKDIDNIKTLTVSRDESTEDIYKEDFLDLLDTIAAKECTYNYKTKEKEIPQSAVQLGVIADEISEHKAYKYIGIKETLEDGTINHGLQPLPIAMLAIQGYADLKAQIGELRDIISKQNDIIDDLRR
ncbi:MAG: phage tail protein [Eubacteriales bacterium]|nr:phage tail protein [Eubacteriales bacterium]